MDLPSSCAPNNLTNLICLNLYFTIKQVDEVYSQKKAENFLKNYTERHKLLKDPTLCEKVMRKMKDAFFKQIP